MASQKRDYYEVLGIAKKATQEEIKKSYRQLAMKYHPDRHSGGNKEAEDKFKEASEAYAVLSDPEKRSQYDQFGHSLGGGGFSGFEGFEGAFSDFGDVFGDLFGDFFGSSGSSRRERGRRGSDLQYNLEITLEEVAKGKDAVLNIPRQETCETCSGSGAEPGSKKVSCNECRGTGQIRVSQGFFMFQRTCPRCEGGGEKIEKLCKDCRGSGRVEKLRKLNIKIPAGVESGSRLRVSGEGEGGKRGGGTGDLYVFITVKEHSFFHRDGQELLCDIEIPFTIACLGGQLTVPSILEEPLPLKIPAGTQSGKIFKLAGKGLPNLQGRVFGDQLVRVKIEVPAKLSDKEKKLLEEFSKLRNEETAGGKNFFDKLKDSLKS